MRLLLASCIKVNLILARPVSCASSNTNVRSLTFVQSNKSFLVFHTFTNSIVMNALTYIMLPLVLLLRNQKIACSASIISRCGLHRSSAKAGAWKKGERRLYGRYQRVRARSGERFSTLSFSHEQVDRSYHQRWYAQAQERELKDGLWW